MATVAYHEGFDLGYQKIKVESKDCPYRGDSEVEWLRGVVDGRDQAMADCPDELAKK